MAEIALLREACEWATALRLDDIPADVRDLATAQLLSLEAAAHASMRHPVGDRLWRTGFPAGAILCETGWPGDAARQALLTMALDFDETAFAGHLGHASAIPPMIVGTETGAGGAEVMVAQVAAAEVAARGTAALTPAGAVGLEGLMEAPGGLLEQLAAVPLPEVFSGWGSRWHLRTLSIKAIPGCAYLTSAVEAAASLAPVDAGEVESVEVAASVFTLGMEAESSAYINGPESPLPALGFSVGYNLATALESGSLDVDDLHGERLASSSRWELAGRVRLSHDPDLTVAALAAAAPLGAAIALAGERARAWLQSRGASADIVDRVLADAAADPEFERPAKRIGARVTVRLRDGRTLEAERDAARGCCQEPVAARLGLAEAKYRAHAGAGGEAYVEAAGRFESMRATELKSWYLAGAVAGAKLT